MNQFTASNGRIIVTSEEACGASTHVKIGFGEGGRAGDFTMTAAERDALREFFRAEEDERLERWRFPELPWLLVYHWGQPTSAGVVVVDEGSGAASRVIHRNADPENESPDYRAARAYFEAHPEPKPWHEAKPGDVWLLKFSGFGAAGASPWTVRNGKSIDAPLEFVYPQNGNALALTDQEIIDARRIYPEVTE